MIQRGALGVAEALIGGAVLVHQARKKSEDREKDRTTSQNSNSGGKNLLKAAAQGFLDGDAGYDSSEAESELSDSSKEQALRLARAHGNKDIIGILMGEKIDPDAPAPFFGNILQEAVSYGNTAIVRTLLNKGSNVNLQGGHFSSALQCAAAGENSEIFRILIKKGADIHVEGGNYGSVLQAAAYRSSLENVSLLVSSGANVNAQGGQFGTPLAAAASMGALDVVKLLLQSRADPNLRQLYHVSSRITKC